MLMTRGKFTLGATGDILLHKRVYNKAKQSDGSYNFDEMFRNVEHLFDKEHLIIVNQESIIAGEEFGLSDFPNFNSPIEIGYKLKELNVDIASIANNHILDHGEKGILKSIENWEEIGLPYVGAYKSEKDQNTLRIFNKNGLRVCFLSYTKGLGGKKPPKGKEYLVNQYGVTKYNGYKGVAGLRRLIAEIKKQDLADVFIVSIHFGKEYQMEPTAYQKETVSSIADAGADVIIGHHPHVVQPFEYVTDSKGREVFVAYSLGNFFSGQKGLYRQIGGYLSVDIEKPEGSKMVKVSNPRLDLTFVDATDKNDYRLHLLRDYVKNNKEIITDIGSFESEKVYARMIQHTKSYLQSIEVQ